MYMYQLSPRNVSSMYCKHALQNIKINVQKRKKLSKKWKEWKISIQIKHEKGNIFEDAVEQMEMN